MTPTVAVMAARQQPTRLRAFYQTFPVRKHAFCAQALHACRHVNAQMYLYRRIHIYMEMWACLRMSTYVCTCRMCTGSRAYVHVSGP